MTVNMPHTKDYSDYGAAHDWEAPVDDQHQWPTGTPTWLSTLESMDLLDWDALEREYEEMARADALAEAEELEWELTCQAASARGAGSPGPRGNCRSRAICSGRASYLASAS